MVSRPLCCLAAVAVLSTPVFAQNVTANQGISITVRGIVDASFYAQDADFGTGNGQKANYVTAERDKWAHGGDARNTRLTLAIAGPEVSRGWRGSATAELDFFGAYAAGGAFGDEQPQPRLRLAYADLSNGRTTLRIGQDWDLLFGNIPVSTSHLAFPPGHGSGGFVGWRFMQVRLMRVLSRPNARTTTRVQLAMLNGSWTDEAGGGDNTFSAGERAFPQLEARYDISTARWSVYVVGHYDKKDSVPPAPGVDISSWAVEGGVNTTRGDLTLQGNVWVGKAMAHHIAQVVQFGDIKGWGAWAQVGYNLSPKWSAWGFYGTDKPSKDNLTTLAATAVTESNAVAIPVANRRFSSWLFVPMIRYKSGPYAVGLELFHNDVKVGTTGKVRSGNQVVLSARYDF